MPDRFTLQQVAQLVASSPNFTKDEAEEWLRLVPLMNDQQLREVTRILRSMAEENVASGMQRQPTGTPIAPQQSVNVVPVSTPQIAMPPAPTGNLSPEIQAKPPGSAEAVIADALNDIKKTEEERAKSTLTPSVTSSAPVWPIVDMPAAPVSPTPPENTPKMHINRHAGVALHEVKTLEDVSQISVESLRAWGEEGLFSALKPLVQEYTWALTRLEFEQSTLFVAYVDTGRVSLGAVHDDSKQMNILERHEFEAVADLLQRLAAVG